uniref:Uncharacterized protein n=1 Tax=Anguilla anguilla TaxID=7936 RepID=A0A0E9WCP5_ANGAN
MSTAEALKAAALRIFSLKVQTPRCSSATQCVVLGGTMKWVWGSQPLRSTTPKMGAGAITIPLASVFNELCPYLPSSFDRICFGLPLESRTVTFTVAL